MKVFIASSTTSLQYVHELKNFLSKIAKEEKKELNIETWDQRGIFSNGNTTIGELMDIRDKYDFAIFFFHDDDIIIQNKQRRFLFEILNNGLIQEDVNVLKSSTFSATRDNVIFEYGLFASTIGLNRCFVVRPSDKDFRVLSDISGITTINYKKVDQTISLETYFKISKDILHNMIEIERKNNNISNKYFSNFHKKEEPPILGKQFVIDYDRSFNLLLYMLRQENFKEFRAFDLAVQRWEELISDQDPIESQVQNISKQILSSQIASHTDGRCSIFRRILVLSNRSLTSNIIKILKYINDYEREHIKSTPGKTSETKVFFVDNDLFDYQIAHLNDFALFSGSGDDFAIVEKSLRAPILHNSDNGNKVCIIDTDKESLEERKIAFDRFWIENTLSIGNFLNTYYLEDRSRTLDKAFRILHDYRENRDKKDDLAVFIETSYVEMRNIGDKRRLKADFRAVDFLNRLLKDDHLSLEKSSIYLDAFLNDFKSISDGENCSIEHNFTVKTRKSTFSSKKEDVLEDLKNKNLSFNIPESNTTSFLMTETRNSCIKKVKKALNDPTKKDKFILNDNDINCGVFYRSFKGHEIFLGYMVDDNRFVPNCTALMAEHYFNLFEYAYKLDRTKTKKDFWIFDFILHSERNEVSSGAKLAFDMYSWPKNLTVHIVNCWYNDDGLGEGDVAVHHGPYYFS